MDVIADWFWQGLVVEAIVRFFTAEGWIVFGMTAMYSKERGVDIQAARSGRILLVEAKGDPAKTSRDPLRAGKARPTSPTNQSQQWCSHALLEVMGLQTKRPDAVVALGFRIFPLPISIRRDAL
ncbi:hypothetical protein [Rhodopseudomonas palustris]|uniref:hypothetical protein n=1 Tax=Rhodopseudomonas palustris TaxID=1076 RepID=UPI0021F38267|nr:hypothetical protein [Rhodopseudomonas palustris]UYO55811.1 hypothetical protein KQX61_10560 [Rhodopseudomonas palustris]